MGLVAGVVLVVAFYRVQVGASRVLGDWVMSDWLAQGHSSALIARRSSIARYASAT